MTDVTERYRPCPAVRRIADRAGPSGISDEVLRICEERAFARGYMAGATDMRDDYQKVLDSHSEYVHDLFKDKTVYDHIADVLNHDLPEEECDIACIRQQRRTRSTFGDKTGPKLDFSVALPWWTKHTQIDWERSERQHQSNPDLSGGGDEAHWNASNRPVEQGWCVGCGKQQSRFGCQQQMCHTCCEAVRLRAEHHSLPVPECEAHPHPNARQHAHISRQLVQLGSSACHGFSLFQQE